MIVKELILTNFGRHERLEFNVKGSVAGLLGPNGVGKSTVLDALEYAITGETRDAIGTYVRNQEGNAKVSLVFQKGGQEGRILRQFGKTTKRRLEWDTYKGDKALTRGDEVDALMAKIFGADKQAIANAVFINQGMLEGILFKKTSERKEMFIKLVSMSFCATRARTLEGKIKKLETTITDLAPMIQAVLTQRESSGNAVVSATQTLEKLPDHTLDIAFCEARIHNEALMQRALSQLGQLTNSIASNEADIVEMLGLLNAADQNEVMARVGLLNEKIVGAQATLQHYNSVVADLTHYDRVTRELGDLRRRLVEIMGQAETLNPEKLTPEQIQERLKKAGDELAHGDWLVTARNSLIGWQKHKAKLEAALQARAVPSISDKDMAERRTQLGKRLATVDQMKALLETQKRLASCLAGQFEQAHARCPDCGLTLADPKQLSPERITAYEAEIAAMVQSNSTENAEVKALYDEAMAYKDFVSKQNGEIAATVRSITQIETDISKCVVTMDVITARAERDRFLAMYQTLPILIRNTKQVSDDMLAKMKEQQGYKLAVNNLDKRANFSVEEGNRLRKVNQDLTQEMDAIKPTLNHLREAIARQNTYASQKEQLLAYQREIQAYLDEPLPPAVLQFMAAMLNNMEAVKYELKLRQDSRQNAKGRLEQAQTDYTRINREYQELLQRDAANTDKRKLIEDLRKLRDIMDTDGLPMAVVRHHFSRLANLTQEYLRKLDANFAITIDPDQEIGFKFIRLDESTEYEMPMTKLSGGQKVRLCLAFLMAVQRRLVREVGLLVLDEPSVHVDPAGVEALAELLKEMQSELQHAEMQVIVSDHHPALEECFSSVLRIS